MNLKTGEDFWFRLDWQDQKNIIPQLAGLTESYPDQKIIIIWDNAGFHRGKKIRELLGENKPLQNVHLIWLPPYAPDKNPQESIWIYAKDRIGNQVYNQSENLMLTFETIITGPKFNYKF